MAESTFPTPADKSSGRDSRFIPASLVASRQSTHFVAWTLLPIAGCIAWFAIYPTVTPIDVVVFACMWAITGGLGISIGYHRYFTHGAFDARPVLQVAMAAAGSAAAQGPVTYWVSLHRCHHQHSDERNDPHSPRSLADDSSRINKIRSFLHGHMGWVLRHDVPNAVCFARDLLRNPVARFFDKSYLAWVSFGIIFPGFLMLLVETSPHGFMRGCVFGGLLRIIVGNQIIWAINSVCHCSGAHVYDTRDCSTNNWLLAIPAFGEGWHNNHHAFPWSARFGLKWWQIDIGWITLRCLSLFGLASNLKQPTNDKINDYERMCHPVSTPDHNVR